MSRLGYVFPFDPGRPPFLVELQDHLRDLSSHTARKIANLVNDDSTDKESVCGVASMLREMGVTRSDISQNVQMFRLSVEEVHQLTAYFTEGGCQFRVDLLTDFRLIASKSVHVLKCADVIPKKINVPEKLHSHCGCNLQDFQELDDSHSYHKIHRMALLHYIEWYLGVRLSRSQSSLISKYTSISHVAEIFHIFKHDLNVPKHEVISHLEILNVIPLNVKAIINCSDANLDLNMQKIIRSNLSLLHLKPSSIKKVLDVLAVHGFTSEEISKCPEVLGQDPFYVEKMALTIKSIPELKHSQHVQLKLIALNHLQHRLGFARSQNVRSGTHFGIPAGLFKPKNALPPYISKELNMSISAVEDQLRHHPTWTKCQFTSVVETLEVLREMKYSEEDIQANILVLLYDRSLVKETLIRHVYCDPIVKELHESPCSKHLSLCLYYMERENHFCWNPPHSERVDPNVD